MTHLLIKQFSIFCFVSVPYILLVSCSDGKLVTDKSWDGPPISGPEIRDPMLYNPYGDSIFDLNFSDGSNPNISGTANVNLLLWQSSIEVLSFMGIKDIDPAVGLIITEWYSNATSSDELQVVVTINGSRLVSSAVTVGVASRDTNGKNRSNANSQMSVKLKDAILSRAREKRSSSLN